MIPQTPAEQQQAIDDALERLDAGTSGQDVLRDLYATLRQKAPAVWERIIACPACKVRGEAHRLECRRCRADRLEYCALMGL